MINFALGMPGPSELIVILIIILIIFGPKNLPKLARSMGKSIKEFKDATDGLTKDEDKEEDKPETKEQAPAPEKKDAKEEADDSELF